MSRAIARRPRRREPLLAHLDVMVSEEMQRRLAERAGKEHRTTSSLVRHALAEYLANR